MTAPALRTTPAPAWRNLNTLQRLWASLYIVWALDVLLLIAAITGARVHRGAMQAVGKDTAPSIIAAQHIKSSLADMDANAANELLGEPGKMPQAVKAYEKDRRDAATALIEAAKNITYGDAEQKPIEAIQVGMGTYEAKVQRARDLHEQGDAAYVRAYRDAANVIDEVLLPEADNLDRANHDVLERTYDEQKGKSVATIVFVLLMGAALVAALVFIQKFLNRKMRRILNPLLVLATLLTLGFVLYTYSVLGSERADLKVAKEDAFTSIHALWRARAVAYAANADESRYLLDAAHAQEHEDNFHKKAALLASIPSDAVLRTVLDHVRDGTKVNAVSGYLIDELNNITFEGEREAAVSALEYFNQYLSIDTRIRYLQQKGKHAEALELCIGTKPGESNAVFDQFDQAVGKTLDINQQEFDKAVAGGFSVLSHFEIKASIVAVVIALLAFFGLLKRIQEYR